MLGLDLAAVDGNRPPDWKAVRAAGVRFVIERASYITSADPLPARDRDAIRDAGLTFATYPFPVMNVGAPTQREQVAAYKASSGLIPGVDLPPTMDLEFPKGIAGTGRSRADLAAWIGGFRAELEDAFGVTPMAYSSARVLDDIDSDCLAGAADGVLAGCPLWLARYPFATRIDGRLDADGLALPPLPHIQGAALWFHQYQGDAVHVPGFTATVDLDRFFPVGAGETSARVQWMQRRLAASGLTPGVNDIATVNAVKSYQQAQHLEVDGIVGPATFARLAWTKPSP